MNNNLSIFCFTSAARTKSFSITARELRISQQAVSKHIKSLEEEIGYPLFFRNRTALELTKAGSLMLEYFSIRGHIIQDISKEFSLRRPASSLTIGISQWIKMPPRFIDLAAQFRRTNPEVDLHLQDLDAQEAMQMLREGTLDIFLTTRYMSRYLPVRWKSAIVDRLPLYLIKSRRATYTEDQLAFYPFFAPEAGEEDENTVISQIHRTLSRLGFIPHQVTVCPDMGSVMLNVLLNDGMTLGCYLPERNSTGDYTSQETGLYAELALCYPGSSANPYIRVITDFFTEGVHHAENTD